MKRILILLLLIALLTVSASTLGDESFEIIRQGSKGEPVVRVQERLLDLGYYAYKLTGSYQTVTRSAVISYQVASGLMSDGTIGEESYRELFLRSAVRAPFRATIPLTYTAQSGSFRRGTAQRWEVVREHLLAGTSYTITNAATGESVSLLYNGGENHAEFTIPSRWAVPDAATVKLLQSWLGSTNSYYKCAVLLQLEDQSIAASIQWNAESAICLYVTGSTSHIFGLPDPDHEAMIQKAANG